MSMQLLIIILHMRYDFNRHWKENLLCPFHYFGITDLQLEGDAIDENTGLKDFIKLTSDERVSYVIEQIEYYGYCGRRAKGLVFCSSKKEASVLSTKL